MDTYSSLGYTAMLSLPQSNNGINTGNVDGLVSSGAIGYQQTSLSVLNKNEDIKSGNFVTGVSGWRIQGSGNVEFGSGYFRGDITGASGTFSGTITATTGSIGGWSISSVAIYKDGATDALSAGMAPADYPFYAGKKYTDRATAPFKVEPSGKLTVTDIVATGVINAQSGYLSAGVYVDTVNGIICESGGLNVGNAGHIRGGQTDYATGTGFFLGYSNNAYKFSIGNTTDYLKWSGTAVSLLCSGVNAITIQYGSDILLEHGGDIKFTSVTAPTACTATLVEIAGNINVGTHSYKVTYVNATGETELGATSNTITTDATHKQVDLSAISVSTSSSVTSRKIYRTKAGGTSYYLLTTINDNITTTYTDNIADTSLTGGIANNKENDTFGKIIVEGVESLSLGYKNIFIGQYAGNVIATGYDNVGISTFTLYKNTTGYQNIAIGYAALYENTSGFRNVAIGAGGVLYSNTTGDHNTAMGYAVLYVNTTGDYNTAIGYSVLNRNTTGYLNSAMGYAVLNSNTTGYYNSVIGSYALCDNTTGYYNTAMGYAALYANTTGYQNSAVGSDALSANTTGYRNSVMGSDALNRNTTGYHNTANGFNALYFNTEGYQNTAVGYRSLRSNTTGNNNIALGYYAGTYETASNAFYVNNQDRTDTAGDKAKSILYGVMAANAVNQKLTINALLNLSVTKTPATAGATGVTGDIAWDASYVYVCTATNTWKRAGIATW